jgi:ankyrin repeat protein
MNRIAPANSRIDLLFGEEPDQVQQQANDKAAPSLHHRPASSSPVLTPTAQISNSISHSLPVVYAVNSLLTSQSFDKSPEQLLAFIATASESEFNEFISKPGSLWSLTTKNAAGHNVMHLAAEQNLPEVVEKLLKLSISKDLVQTPNLVGSIPLMIAAESGHADVARSLLSRRSIKAQLNAATVQGDTALMVATASGNMEIVKLLIDAGSSLSQINAINHAGCNALDIAYRHGHHAIAALFEMYG